MVQYTEGNKQKTDGCYANLSFFSVCRCGWMVSKAACRLREKEKEIKIRVCRGVQGLGKHKDHGVWQRNQLCLCLSLSVPVICMFIC